MNRIFWSLFFKRIKSIRFLMRDKTVPIYQKLIIVFGVIYLISPIDLIPYPVLGFSWIDDFALWIYIISLLKEKLDKYSEGSSATKFNGKKIIDDVKYEVNSDEEDDDHKKHK